MKTKSQIFSELKKAIRHNLVCGNAYYFVVFNGNEEEDYMVIDERFINEKGAEMVKELKERRKEMTKVTFFGGSGEDELLWEKKGEEPEVSQVEFLSKDNEVTVISKRIFDGLTRQYREVVIKDNCYTQNGEKLYRIETKGKSGKKLYRNGYYFNNEGKEEPVYGMDGSTGHGWGGRIVGYLLKEELEKYGVK